MCPTAWMVSLPKGEGIPVLNTDCERGPNSPSQPHPGPWNMTVPSPIKRWGFVSPLLETGLALRLTLAKGGGSDDIPQGPLSLLDPCLSHEKRPGLSFWRLSGPAEHSRAASPQPTLEFTTHTLMSPSQMSPAQPRAMEPQYPCEQKKVFSVLCHWIYAALLWQQTTETTGCVVLSHILWLNITQMQKAE